ncbi:type II toxin-antitoxin system HicB family antitoxin [Desulfofalx alkaliphila]|uniref:type II toxin-antitoxin system HicB family antitoxin n=1 Tax=Desulfofalx alkaliphila TaxID=105483 RepID=UPI0004E14FAA|nr:type II toxin-antitoxin system HicB family antitoxin [Desulfofalx alkaliphila]
MALKWDTVLKEEEGKHTGTITMTVHVTVEKAEEGDGYYALTPDLPGCATVGDTPEQAVENMRLTIKDWLIKDNCG